MNTVNARAHHLSRQHSVCAVLFAAACAVLMLATTAAFGRIIRVNPASTGGDGSSWPAAMVSLRAALEAAAEGDEIWATAGTFLPYAGSPSDPDAKGASFVLKKGVAVYGGFVGTETERQQRSFLRHRTVLSGDLAGNDADAIEAGDARRADNSLHVVRAENCDSATILDGVIITGGNARNVVDIDVARGGGLVCFGGRVTLRNCIFERNAARNGGGAAAFFSASPTIMFCTFSRNRAGTTLDSAFGGAVVVDGNQPGAMPMIANSFFWDNGAAVNELSDAEAKGGAVYIARGTSLLMVGCVLAQNQVTANKASGGGLFAEVGSLDSIINCTIVENSVVATGGRGGGVAAGAAVIANSIFWGNVAAADSQIVALDTVPPTVRNAIVQRGYPGTLVGDSDPEFIDAASPAGEDNVFGTPDDGLRPSGFSSAIDAGYIPALRIRSDILGNPRFANVIVDIGAYETPRIGSFDHGGVLAELRRGGLVLAFRHSLTNWTQRDSSAWINDRSNCALQRNLSDAGRNQAHVIGGFFRALGIPTAVPVASPMCRTKQTAELAFGSFTEADIWMNDPSRWLAERRTALGTRPAGGTNTVVVSHQLAIISVTSFHEEEISEGDCIILRPLGNDAFQEIDHWTPDLLERLQNLGSSDVERDPHDGAAPSAGPAVAATLFPVPSSRRATLRVELAAAAELRVDIASANGGVATVVSDGRREAGVHLVDVDVSALASGFYVCRVWAGARAVMVPLVVVR